MTKVTF